MSRTRLSLVYACASLLSWSIPSAAQDDEGIIEQPAPSADSTGKDSADALTADSESDADKENVGDEDANDDAESDAPRTPVNVEKAFPNKLIFSETPEIGYKWRGGIRMNDLLVWDVYWNIGGIGSISLNFSGLPKITTADSVTLVDNFRSISLKSRPIGLSFARSRLMVGGGVRLYSASFGYMNDSTGEGIPVEIDRSFGPFVSACLFLRDRHCFNVAISVPLQSRQIGEDKRRIVSTVFITPGYRVFLGHRKNWSLGLEYLMGNPEELPIKLLQYAFDPDGLEFYNPDRQWISMMFWGVTYSRRHFRVDINIGNHISFQGPIVPFLGVGWNL
jgi:hypothetical protein